MDQAGGLPPRDKSAVLLFIAALSVVVLFPCIAAPIRQISSESISHRHREMAVSIALGRHGVSYWSDLDGEPVLLLPVDSSAHS